jgi:hypothetical protein
MQMRPDKSKREKEEDLGKSAFSRSRDAKDTNEKGGYVANTVFVF